MAKVYVSSTYVDLKDHREEVCRTLRRNQHQVTNMEDYVATDQRPVDKCLADVASCDVYVGIFAWRYGYIPDTDNPERKSITELEFRHAVRTAKHCLIFLVRDDVPWSPALMDKGAESERITTLRAELGKDKLVGHFETPNDLATEVSTAVNNWEKQRRQEVSHQDSHAVREGLGALTELMWTRTVKEAVAAFRIDFLAACQQIDVMGDYKDLHDHLHNLQFRCFNCLVPKARRFSNDEMVWIDIADYERTLREVVDCLQEVAGRTSMAPNEGAWIQELVRARGELSRAVERSDPEQLKRAIWTMKPVVAVQPSRINTLLNAAAGALRLDALVNAVTCVRDNLNRPDLDPRKVCQFQAGVDSLIRLSDGLDDLRNDHDTWQQVDNKLRLMEDYLDQEMEQFVWSWEDVAKQTGSLHSGSTEAWAASFRAEGEKLQNAITAEDPVKIRQSFLSYRSQAGSRFYLVDKKLKKLCGDLRNIDEPLAAVLREIEK